MKNIKFLLGIEQLTVSHAERMASALGGFVSILSVLYISQWILGIDGAMVIVASMGASAVLLFAVPHGNLSQPWSVFGGHVLSALIGVSCAILIPNEMVAGAVAVGLAIGVMYYLKCIHPPGGATALAAVIGGDTVHNLGYQFVITPVLINVVVILLIAILFNYLFEWRRYPLYLHRRRLSRKSDSESRQPLDISHEDFVYALSQIDSFVDISEYEMLRIYDIATQKSMEPEFDTEKLQTGNYYSNGKYGDEWSVRQVVDGSFNDDPHKHTIVYKVVAGLGRRSSSYSSREDFIRWAKYQVIRDEDNWKRLVEDD